MNIVLLQGKLSRDPEERELQSGALITYEVTTRGEDGPAATAPVCWFDPPAAGRKLQAGDEVTVVGEVRRRFFRAGGATQSRTEVVAQEVVLSRRRAQVRRALERARELLDERGADG
jgi:single-strand DNA-binding protein